MKRAAFLLANLAAVASLAWPLVTGGRASGEASAHAVDAPLLVALTVPLLLVVAVREVSSGDARTVALLGVLVAVNAMLRIPKGLSGEGFMFVLPVLVGWWMGGTFAFLHGAFSILVSAVVTGGIGPWLPFQMFGLAWVGVGAAGMRRLTGGRAPVLSMAAWSVAASYLYGAAVTLWFWPFLRGTGPTFWAPDHTLLRFWRFYLLTSFPWDTSRALLSNVPLVAVLARPVGRLLARAKERFSVQVV